jgi:uncharacterized repeat protein (TIGR01451 family)
MRKRMSSPTRMALLLVAVVAGLALTAGVLNGLHAMSVEAQAAPSAHSPPSAMFAGTVSRSAAVQPLQQCYVITFQQGLDGYLGCRDTRITAERPNDNYCNDELVLGMMGDGRVLVQFLDLERSIPQNARIVKGTLGLYVYNYGQRSVPIPVAAYPVVRPWKECEATWNKASYYELWGKPGCDDTATDRSPIALDQTSLYDYDQWYEWDVTAAAADWLKNPLQNRGLVLVPITRDSGEFDIWNSEYIGPYLRIEYCLGPDIGISKELTSPAGGSAISGELVEFTIRVVNTGTTAITDLTLTDSFDPEYLSYATSSVPPRELAPGKLEWTAEELDAFLPLAVDDDFVITVEFQTLKPTSGTLNCLLAVGFDQFNQPVLPREACDDVEIQPRPPALSMSKQVTDPPGGTAAVGGLLTFTLRISNIGENAITALHLTDTYESDYLRLVSASILPSQQEPGAMTWLSDQLGVYLPLAPGESFEITLVFEALSETPNTRNGATVQGTDEYGQQTPPEMDSDAVQIVPAAALEVSKQLVIPASGLANVGDTVRFVLGIKNVGGVAITSLTAVDEYSSSYISPLFPWSVEPDDWMPGIVTWTWEATDPFLPLAPQDSFTWTVDFVALAPVSMARNCLTVDGMEACDDVQVTQPERFKIYLPAMAGPLYECDPRCGQWDILQEFNTPADLNSWIIDKPAGTDLRIESIPGTAETGLHLFSTADTSKFPVVYRNDLFEGLSSCFCMEVRFKHTGFSGFGSTISVNSSAYSGQRADAIPDTDPGDPGKLLPPYRLKNIEDVLSIHHVKGSRPTFEVRLIRDPASDRWKWLWPGVIEDSALHTVQIQVLGDPRYALRVRRADGEWQQVTPVNPGDTASSLLPRSIYLGSHADQSQASNEDERKGPWTQLWVDYIRISRGDWVSLD